MKEKDKDPLEKDQKAVYVGNCVALCAKCERVCYPGRRVSLVILAGPDIATLAQVLVRTTVEAKAVSLAVLTLFGRETPMRLSLRGVIIIIRGVPRHHTQFHRDWAIGGDN